MKSLKEIDDLFHALRTATEKHAAKSTALQFAINEECTAITEVNKAQKAVDQALAELRKEAPRDSDWKRERGLPVDA